MTHNDALRSIASLFPVAAAVPARGPSNVQVDVVKLVEIVCMGGGDVELADVVSYLKREDEEGFAPCPDMVMAQFLHGLVLYKRGKQEGQPPVPLETEVTNNLILKKVRIAFELKDADIAAILTKAGLTVSKSERAAFFRHRDDRHYRACSDPVLQNFLTGLNR